VRQSGRRPGCGNFRNTGRSRPSRRLLQRLRDKQRPHRHFYPTRHWITSFRLLNLKNGFIFDPVCQAFETKLTAAALHRCHASHVPLRRGSSSSRTHHTAAPSERRLPVPNLPDGKQEAVLTSASPPPQNSKQPARRRTGSRSDNALDMLSQLKGASSYMIDEKTEQPTSVALLQSRLSSEHAYATKPCSSAIFFATQHQSRVARRPTSRLRSVTRHLSALTGRLLCIAAPT